MHEDRSCNAFLLRFYIIFILLTLSSHAATPGLDFYPCEEDTSAQCLQGLLKYQGDQNIVKVSKNSSAVDIICKELKESLACVDRYIEKCDAGEDASSYQRSSDFIREKTSKYCTYRSSSEDLAIRKCLENVDSSNGCGKNLEKQLQNIGSSIFPNTPQVLKCKLFNGFEKCLVDDTSKNGCNINEKKMKYLIKSSVVQPLTKLNDYKNCDQLSQQYVEPCSPQDIETCIKHYYNVSAPDIESPDAALQLFLNETAFKSYCKSKINEQVLDCVESFIDRCDLSDDPFQKHIFRNLFGNAVKYICSHKTLSLEVVSAAYCIRDNHHELYDKCGDPFQHYKDHDDMCLFYEQYEKCILDTLSKSKCGPEGEKFMKVVLLKSISSEIKDIQKCVDLKTSSAAPLTTKIAPTTKIPIILGSNGSFGSSIPNAFILISVILFWNVLIQSRNL